VGFRSFRKVVKKRKRLLASSCLMGWACGTYGGKERYAEVVGGGNQRERDHWGDQDVGGRIILR
jgi:hypothetical protein